MELNIDFTKYKDQLQIKKIEDKRKIFDPIRRKYMVLTPEELVRQLVIQYLIIEKYYNKNFIRVEKSLVVNKMQKRCDILIYNNMYSPQLLVECKAARVKITQTTFEQIARYNMPLKVDTLLVSNGIQTYCCNIDHEKSTFDFLSEIPPATPPTRSSQ